MELKVVLHSEDLEDITINLEYTRNFFQNSENSEDLHQNSEKFYRNMVDS